MWTSMYNFRLRTYICALQDDGGDRYHDAVVNAAINTSQPLQHTSFFIDIPTHCRFGIHFVFFALSDLRHFEQYFGHFTFAVFSSLTHYILIIVSAYKI